jgi:hypothetical protein
VVSKVTSAIVLLVYVAWNLVAWNLSEPTDSYDTIRYFQPLSDPLNPGIVVNSLYLTLNSGTLITLAQVMIATTAWVLLALAILVRLRWNPVAWIMSSIVLLFSLTTPMWSWHMLTYTESLTNSALVFWFASIVWLTAKSESALKSLIPFSSAAVLIALTRPQLLIFVLPTQLVILVWWWRQNRRPFPAVGSLLAIAPFMAFAAYRVQQVTQIDVYRMRYAFHNLVGKNSSFRDYALVEMPPCDLVPQALNGPAPWNDAIALESTMISSCPDTWMWFRSDAVILQNWVPARFSQAIVEFGTQIQGIILSIQTQSSALPSFLSTALLNPSYPLIWALAFLIAGIGLAIAAGAKPKFSVLSVLSIAIVTSTVLLQMFLVWGADGESVERHQYPVIPMILIALLVFPSVWSKTRSSKLAEITSCPES